MPQIHIAVQNTSCVLRSVEAHLAKCTTDIEHWFQQKVQHLSPLFYASVDLRNAGFKLAPIDTNLFPAGFNNLSPDCLPVCIRAVQATLAQLAPGVQEILLIPENHTRNIFYLENLASLQRLLQQAGLTVRIGSQLPLPEKKTIKLPSGSTLCLEPLRRVKNRLGVSADFFPPLILMNNDLAEGVPELLKGLDQRIIPALEMGWQRRSKIEHFHNYATVSQDFSEAIGIDPWRITPAHTHCRAINFMTGEGVESIADHTDQILKQITQKYREYHIDLRPFVVIKADCGTYGMAVMTVFSAKEILQLNRKLCRRMSVVKGGRAVSGVIIQEGIHSIETCGAQNAVAEPVIYTIGNHAIGGFYRIHKDKKENESLNVPGMHFQPLVYKNRCQHPCQPLRICTNRFYAYTVVARLGLLAASLEVFHVKNKMHENSGVSKALEQPSKMPEL